MHPPSHTPMMVTRIYRIASEIWAPLLKKSLATNNINIWRPKNAKFGANFENIFATLSLIIYPDSGMNQDVVVICRLRVRSRQWAVVLAILRSQSPAILSWPLCGAGAVGHGNGSPSATNVVVVVLVIRFFKSAKASSFQNRSSLNFAYRFYEGRSKSFEPNLCTEEID